MPPVNGTYCVTVMKDRCINFGMPGKCATCVEVCPYCLLYTSDAADE